MLRESLFDRLFRHVADDLLCHLAALGFPVRLETRFKAVGQGRTELWARVYPDECSVDTFEPVPTDDEVVAIRVSAATFTSTCCD